MFLEQRGRRGPALAPVTASASVMVLAATAALVLAWLAAPVVLVQALAALAVAGLVAARLTVARAREWWSRPVPGARRRPTR